MRLPSDLERKSSNSNQIAIVVAIDCSMTPPSVKVKLDKELISDWMPYHSSKAGAAFTWDPPEIGDQGSVLTLGGENETSIFFGGIHTEKDKPTNLGAKDFYKKFKNGDHVWHKESGDLEIKISGELHLVADGSINIFSNSGQIILQKGQKGAARVGDPVNGTRITGGSKEVFIGG